MWPSWSSLGDGSSAKSSSGNPAAESGAGKRGRGRSGSGLTATRGWPGEARGRVSHLRPLGLDAAEAVGAVDDSVLGDHLVGVDIAAGPDDAAAGQDDVPANKCCQREAAIPVSVMAAM